MWKVLQQFNQNTLDHILRTLNTENGLNVLNVLISEDNTKQIINII